MKVLVLGAGMYVTGRGNTGVGTVLASLAETSRTQTVEAVTVAATNPANASVVAEAAVRLNDKLNTRLPVRYQTIEGEADADVAALCAETHYDCAVVAIPDHLHYSYAGALIRHGVHCLVVKPLVETTAQAIELEHLRAQYAVHGAVEFHKRWDETNLWIRRSIAEDRLGKLLYFVVDYSQRVSIPLTTFRHWSGQTNIFQYLGVHYADLIHFLTGFLPVRVMAVGTRGLLASRNVTAWDSVHATVIFRNPHTPEDEFVAQFNTNWIDPDCTSALSDQKYKVIGVRGRIECDQKNRGIELVHERDGIQQINPYFSDFLPDADGNLRFSGYGHESIHQFLRDVEDISAGRTTAESLQQRRPGFRQATVSTAIVDCVNQSLADNFNWKEVRDLS